MKKTDLSKTDLSKSDVLKVASNLRGWIYFAYVDKNNGELVMITAGCRTWPTFEAALAHYNTTFAHSAPASGDVHPNWRDETGVHIKKSYPGGLGYVTWWAQRYEAQRILRMLHGRVIDRGREIQIENQRALERKAQRARKAKAKRVIRRKRRT